MQIMILASVITMSVGFTLLTVTWIQSKIGICQMCENGMYVMGSPP